MPQGQRCTAACIHCNGRAALRLRKKDTMKPDLENSRSFAMTLAHRAVRDVRRDGFRQLRNYVDMCALLAQRPDLKRFFDHAQTVLQRTDSLYYKLINNLVAQVNEDAICTAGINLGFDAIISCASNNRKQNGETRSWLLQRPGAGRCHYSGRGRFQLCLGAVCGRGPYPENGRHAAKPYPQRVLCSV